MKSHRILLAAAAAGAIAVAAAGTAFAQGGTGSGTMMGPGMTQGRTGQMTMQRHMMMHHHMMMHRHIMMHRQMRPGMMQGRGMMMRQGMMRRGMGTMFGRRVVRLMNLSVDDARRYLAFRLERIGNKRLKVGEVKAANGTITADIVTVDNSLVQRLNVDRRTGAITYEK